MSREIDDVSKSHDSASGSMFIRSRSVLADICQRMRPHLKLVARKQTQRLPNCKEDESDIVQQSVVKAYERIDQFKGNTSGQWRAWLVQIVSNQAKDVQRFWSQERRAHKNEEYGSHVMQGLVDHTVETPSKVVAEDERQQRVDEALASLSIQEQQLIRWKVFQKTTYRDIAEKLHVTEPTAKRRCDNAIHAFREALTRLDV